MKNKITISIVLAIVLILGIILTSIYRLNSDLLYTEHKQIDISIGKEFENKDILNLVKEVTGNRKAVVQKLEIYEDMAAISIKEISDEELENLNTKINEKYEIENTVDNLQITEMPSVSFADYIRPYIKPIVIACIIIAIYVGIYILIKKRNEKM